MAHKICTEDGTWFRHPQSNLIWSNYTTCVDVEDLEVKYKQLKFYCLMIQSKDEKKFTIAI